MTQKKKSKKENIKNIVQNYIDNNPLKRHDSRNGRWYEDSKGRFYISVTSFDIVDKGVNFHNWLMTNGHDAIRIRDEKATIGTIVHAYIDKLVLGEDVDLRRGYTLDGVHYNFGGNNADDES
tara:strand:- start:800 stop:1165 length:366 start_codon:yes stop_codon:yes gene_type:complete